MRAYAYNPRLYLQDEQEDLPHVLFEQLSLPAKGFSTPLMPKTESFLATSSEPHLGQAGTRAPKTRLSNSSPQAEHLYSKMGICIF